MIGPFRIYFNSRRSLETEGRTNRSTGSGIRSRQGTAGGSSASGCCVVGRHWQASCQWYPQAAVARPLYGMWGLAYHAGAGNCWAVHSLHCGFQTRRSWPERP